LFLFYGFLARFLSLPFSISSSNFLPPPSAESKQRKTGARVFRFSGSLRRENFIKVELGQTEEKSSLSLHSLKALLFFFKKNEDSLFSQEWS